MKYTIFNQDGTVNREGECLSYVEMHGFITFYEPKDGTEDLNHRLYGASCSNRMTNMPVHIEGVERNWAVPDKTKDDAYSVSMYDSSGGVVKRWDDAFAVGMIGGSLFFYHGNKWHIVTGNVISVFSKK